MKSIWFWLCCHVFGFHDWTCRAEQDIKPDPAQVKARPLSYFWEYAQSYCSRCGRIM